MASEQALDVVVRRHVFDTGQPFARARDEIFSGISQPDIAGLFSWLVATSPYREFSSCRRAQGSADLMRFLQFDLDCIWKDVFSHVVTVPLPVSRSP
jgi:hypothetical protein